MKRKLIEQDVNSARVASRAAAGRRGPCWRRVASGDHGGAGASPTTIRRSAPIRPARPAPRYSSAFPCRAPAPMRCRARTSSRAMQLAIEHINSGHELIKKISPKTTKGVLGKEVKFGVADSARQAERSGAGAAALHHREQGGADHRLDLERGRGGAEQARAAREGALRRRHFRLERHHRQGLRALRLPPVLLWPDRRGRDRPGPGQDLRQEQEGRLSDAGLHLRPHRHEVDAGLSRDRRAGPR